MPTNEQEHRYFNWGLDMEFEREEIERIINGVINLFLIPKFLELDMRATSEWEANIHARGNEIWGREYTKQLVEGRPPGTMPPVEAIQRWARAKLGTDDINVAWAIAKTIEAKGTSWFPHGSDLLEVLESQEVLDYITAELTRLVVIQVQKQFKREFA